MNKSLLKEEDKHNQENPNNQEDQFLKSCTDLCIERMAAEGIDTEDYDKIHVICVTAGIVVMRLLNHKMHKQIAFHVHYEGNRRTSVVLSAYFSLT